MRTVQWLMCLVFEHMWQEFPYAKRCRMCGKIVVTRSSWSPDD